MKFSLIISLSIALPCFSSMTLEASSKGNNNNYQVQNLINSNLNTATANLSSQINSLVYSGQISQAQGALFSDQLSQISSQNVNASSSPMAAQQAVNQISNLTNQINSATAAQGTYLQTNYSTGRAQNSWDRFKNRFGGNSNYQSRRYQEQSNDAQRQAQWQYYHSNNPRNYGNSYINSYSNPYGNSYGNSYGNQYGSR